MFRVLTVVFIVQFSSHLAAEKVYKWVDENGQIHYGSQRPVGQEAEVMKLKKNYSQAPKSTTQTEFNDLQEGANGDKNQTDKTAAELKADAEAEAAARAQLAAADKVNRKQQCDVAKRNYASLNASTRVTKTNDKGESVRMTDDERVKAMQTSQQAMKQYCK